MDHGMFAVRCATKQDVKGIARLILVAKDRTKGTLLRTIEEEEILRDGFGERFHCLVVKQRSQSTVSKVHSPEPGEMIIGLVIYFFAFSTWEGRFLLIKDLLISPKHEEQHNTVDLLLIQECGRIAKEEKCYCVQFDILRDDSTSLERFCPMAFTFPEWLTIRFPTSALIALASQENKEVSDKFIIRSATKEDMASVWYMIQCDAEYERQTNEVTIDGNVLSEGFEKYFECLIAESLIPVSIDSYADDFISNKPPHDDRIVGMAVYYTIFCKHARKVVHIEHLYVLPQSRNQGLGTELLKECAKIGLSRGCTEMDLEVLDHNTKAVGLYKTQGGVLFSEYINLEFKLPSIVELI